ncbi:MAG TPA: DUF4013 domain-containing protein [Caldilineaceae bacterium]|nr:DUF4013 domain-containing protein [Caldilineaceae bacterium]
MIDYGKSFSFFTEDDHWLEKLGIGVGVYIGSLLAALLLVIVPSFLIYFILPWPTAANVVTALAYYLSIVLLVGYGLRLLRNVRDGAGQPLPEWNDWGNDLVRGFKLIVVALIWTLPLLVLAIPTGIGTMLTNRHDDTTSFFGTVLISCGGCLSFLYWLFVAIMRPGYTIAFLRDEQIKSGLRFDLIFNWTRAHIGSVITVALVSVVAAVVLLFLGVILGPILLCVGWIITLPLAIFLPMLIQSHLYGQLAREFPMEESGSAIQVYTPGVEPTPPTVVEPTTTAVEPTTPTETDVNPPAPPA